ncbi:MAG TPA: MFS transporter [Vicinamibacterales bacterium]|nr:MFS transporter [Vicinamibacterales bacterium]
MKTVDVGAALDDGQWGGYQKLLVAATALTIIFDGLDNQVLGGAIPVMMRDWHVARGALTPALTTGFIGMVTGSFVGGYIGDKFGRRIALLGSLLAFGLLTLLVATSANPTMLAVYRFFTGLGMGGAMPNAASLASEYVPTRQRPFAVTLTIVCIPLGGSLAGLIGGAILPNFGWRILFVVCGVIPLALAAVLLKVLPESPRFLARRRERWPQLVALLRRLGHDVPSDAEFVDAREKAVTRTSVGELFTASYARDTLALCGSFFFCLLSVYMGTNWVPQMLTSSHFSVGTASYGLTAFNVGGVVGAIVGALVIMRFGSRLSMLTMAGLAIAGAMVLSIMQIGPQDAVPVFAMLAWTGGLINAVQTTMYALAAHVYPTSIRSTGVGTAVGVGRIGSVFSPALGQWALDAGGASSYFMLIAGTMSIAFVSLAVVKRHIPGSSSSSGARVGAMAAAH